MKCLFSCTFCLLFVVAHTHTQKMANANITERNQRIANFKANERKFLENFVQHMKKVKNASSLSYKYKTKSNNTNDDDDDDEDENNITKFGCPLQCIQCCGITVSGATCKKSTCKYVPFCPAHAKSIFNLQVKKTHDGIGDGLFAVKSHKGTSDTSILFKDNDFICWYVGEAYGGAIGDLRYGVDGVAPYTVEDYDQIFYDAACFRGLGAYANAFIGRKRINANGKEVPLTANAELVPSRKSVPFPHIQATRNIKHGDEIIVDYGNQYDFEGYEHATLKKKMKTADDVMHYEDMRKLVDKRLQKLISKQTNK